MLCNGCQKPLTKEADDYVCKTEGCGKGSMKGAAIETDDDGTVTITPRKPDG